jgi:hypothetical protein
MPPGNKRTNAVSRQSAGRSGNAGVKYRFKPMVVHRSPESFKIVMGPVKVYPPKMEFEPIVVTRSPESFKIVMGPVKVYPPEKKPARPTTTTVVQFPDELIVKIKYRFAAEPVVLSFLDAVENVREYLFILLAAVNRHLELRKDWTGLEIVAFWCDLLGGARLPSRGYIGDAMRALDMAAKWYKEGYPDGAHRCLDLAVDRVNTVDEQLAKYRGKVEKGGRRAIGAIKIYVMLLSSALGVGAKGVLISKGAWAIKLLKGAAVKGLIGGGAEAATQTSLAAQGMGFDFGAVAKETLKSFAVDLAGGALSKLFLKALTPAVEEYVTVQCGIVWKTLDVSQHSGVQKYVADLLAKVPVNVIAGLVETVAKQNQGKKYTISQFIGLVVESFMKENFKQVINADLIARGLIKK